MVMFADKWNIVRTNTKLCNVC